MVAVGTEGVAEDLVHLVRSCLLSDEKSRPSSAALKLSLEGLLLRLNALELAGPGMSRVPFDAEPTGPSHSHSDSVFPASMLPTRSQNPHGAGLEAPITAYVVVPV